VNSGKKVARGATLYSKKRSDKQKESKIAIKEIKE